MDAKKNDQHMIKKEKLAVFSIGRFNKDSKKFYVQIFT